MINGLIAAALSLGIGYSAGTVPSDVPEACRSAVANQLEQLKVEASRVSGVKVIPQIDNPEFGSISGYNAWVSLQESSGSLVIKLSRACRVREVYTRGGLTL